MNFLLSLVGRFLPGSFGVWIEVGLAAVLLAGAGAAGWEAAGAFEWAPQVARLQVDASNYKASVAQADAAAKEALAQATEKVLQQERDSRAREAATVERYEKHGHDLEVRLAGAQSVNRGLRDDLATALSPAGRSAAGPGGPDPAGAVQRTATVADVCGAMADEGLAMAAAADHWAALVDALRADRNAVATKQAERH